MFMRSVNQVNQLIDPQPCAQNTNYSGHPGLFVSKVVWCLDLQNFATYVHIYPNLNTVIWLFFCTSPLLLENRQFQEFSRFLINVMFYVYVLTCISEWGRRKENMV